MGAPKIGNSVAENGDRIPMNGRPFQARRRPTSTGVNDVNTDIRLSARAGLLACASTCAAMWLTSALLIFFGQI